MNFRHAAPTRWGLAKISLPSQGALLDIGCGGGRTVELLAERVPHARVVGVDHAEESVTMSKKKNRRAIRDGRVEIMRASVSQLPFPDGAFDFVSAIETHFFWPDLPADLREVRRVLKPGGTLVIIAEIYRGANTLSARMVEKHSERMELKLLSPDEHRELFANAGFSDIQVFLEPSRGWICVVGKK